MLPTAALGYFLLLNANQYFTMLQNLALQQTLYFSVGMGLAALFYSFRFRFLPSFVALILAAFSIYKGLDNYASGEFDTFFIARRFQVNSILFILGWLLGWGFIRMRYWSVLVAALFMSGSIALIAKANAETVGGLLRSFSPALLYTVYIVFSAEQIYNYKDKSQKFWWFLTRRLVFFSLLAALLWGGVLFIMRKPIKETVANYGGGGKGKSGQGSMLKQRPDSTFDLNDYSRLSSSLGRSNQLLFCAHINNFFPGTDVPNPLYLTAFYFTKFDTLTETFERDSTIPSNDLFLPDPSKIPLFSTRQDSSVIKNSLGAKMRQTVEIEVYAKSLSPATYLAPNVGYFVQPIAIEKDFKAEFKSAFRAKSYSSVLNSAYFVYNSQNDQIKQFQEMRFQVLREIKEYKNMDDKFMKYYTYMPGNDKFKAISDLAHKITDTAKNTPVDKVLAIRNYFLSKDENGDRLYKYTDNPGIPDLPNASKLLYFLNENHKGYCAYYAGATLFMLRSLGIPSRIAVGFMTEDRSDKNKGWYWYYANQAHAWVQVFFPGFGWLDFDTTVGNDEENRPTPQPDGTPPMQPPKAWLAAEGIVEDIDTLKKTMTMSVKQFVFHDKDYQLTQAAKIVMDMKVAVIYRDSVAIPLSVVRSGDAGTAVSYAEVLKNIEPTPADNAASIVKKLPSVTPIDEVYLKKKEVAKAEEKKQIAAQAKPVDWKKIAWGALGVVCVVLLFIVALPQIILIYYKRRLKGAGNNEEAAYWAYLLAIYYLHMIGMNRGRQTPMHYAKAVIDPLFSTEFTRFMNIYLKVKYAKQKLNAGEISVVVGFAEPFLQKVRSKTTLKKRVAGFMNPFRCAGFFMLPEENEDSE